MFETWLGLSPEFNFPFSHVIIRRIGTNSFASLSYTSSSGQAKWGAVGNSFYQSIWPKLNLQLTSVVRFFAFHQLSWVLSTGAKDEAEKPSGKLLIQCERLVYKQTAAMGLNETNIPWKKKKKPSVPKEAMPGLSLARKADSCQVLVWKRETLADGKAGAVKIKG